MVSHYPSRVENCAMCFLRLPHCEAKGQSDLQCNNQRVTVNLQITSEESNKAQMCALLVLSHKPAKAIE